MKRLYHRDVFIVLLFLMLFGRPAALLAGQFQQRQDEEDKELAPVSSTYAITNATVIPSPGSKLEGANVILKDGLITSVGKNAAVPPEAIVIKGDSLYVYAGFIDGLSHAGIAKPKEESSRERPKDPGNPPPAQAGITPENDVRAVISHDDKSIGELRALGFTVCHAVPYGRMLPGTGSLILLSGESVDDMILQSRSSLFSELAGAQRVYPATVIGVMAKWRELYRQALQAKNYQAMYSANPSGLTRPSSDRVLEAFYPVIDKKMPVLFESDSYLDIQRVLDLKDDLGFDLILGDVKEGWDAIPKIKASGARVFLSLDLPEEKKDDKKDKDKKGGEKKEKEKDKEQSTLSPEEKEALEKRKAEFMALYVGQASAFHKAGVPFGFATLTAKPADIHKSLRRMITAGLTEEQALGALTVQPARLLGLSARLGTVESGKIANLVLSDKPYFDEKANVRYVFVDGRMYGYDPKKTPKADSSAKVDIVGTWTVTTTRPGGATTETLTITKEGATYAGSVSGGDLQDAVPLESIDLNGNVLKYTYTAGQGGQSLKVDVEVTVGEGTFKGNAAAGTAGTFAVEGKKNPDH